MAATHTAILPPGSPLDAFGRNEALRELREKIIHKRDNP